MRICGIKGCGRKYHALGVCRNHYHQARYAAAEHPKAARRSDAKYPSDDALVQLMAEHGSYSKMAMSIGGSREALSDFLKIRPDLKARVESARPTKSTPEERLSRKRQRNRDYQRAKRAVDPEGEREKRRVHMNSYGPEYRQKWNTYNRQRRKAAGSPTLATDEDRAYVRLLRADPCSYCGKVGGEIDHIIPIADGGTNDWWNLTSACGSCNRRKQARSLIRFLLAQQKVA